MSVRAFVSLGDADARRRRRPGGARPDRATRTTWSTSVSTPLVVAESYEADGTASRATVTLDRTGPFGYTVRVLPTHELLASPAELGLVARP